MIEFYGKKLNTYRANLHTHSTTSDGKFTPDEVMKYYSTEGYDVMCMTDHQRINRISAIDSRGMLLLSGVEMHPAAGRIARSHLLCINVPEDFDISIGQDSVIGEDMMQPVIDAVNAAGGLCFFAHPYWCGFRAEEVAPLHGLAGIEVYNTSTRYIGREYNMQIWDELCDMGLLFPALAVDDVHTPQDLFGGWTMICSKERTEASVVEALRTGSFYATQGPEFKRISFVNGVFEAEFTPAVTAVLISNRHLGFCANVPNMTGDGRTTEVTSCRFDLNAILARPDIKCEYIRFQIVDAQGRYAWTNPIATR